MDVNMGVTTEKKNNHSDQSQQVQITRTTSGNLKQLPPYQYLQVKRSATLNNRCKKVTIGCGLIS